MDQIIYESDRKKTPGYAVPIRVLLVKPDRGERFVRVEKWDDEQKRYVFDRQARRIPWPWDAVQELGERLCALQQENRTLRAKLHQLTAADRCREKPAEPARTAPALRAAPGQTIF